MMPTRSNSFPSQKNFLPLLMGPRDKNVTFVVDTSEGMYSLLGSVKVLLTQVLLTKASLRDSLFNIMSFSCKVTKWRDHMTTCVPDSVYEALGWIHTLCCTPGSDLHNALNAAFADPACQAVHLLTSDLPDQPEEVLRSLSGVASTRCVHVFFLSDKCCPDSGVQEYLQCLSQSTGGRCHILYLDSVSAVEQVVTLNSVESWTPAPTCTCGRYCSARAQPHVSLLPLDHRHHFVPTTPISTCKVWERSQGSIGIASGRRVLARKDTDGYYYMGTIIQEEQGRRGLFLVEFCNLTGGQSDWALQHTSLEDMVDHVEAHGHNLVPGDRVLAPWGRDLDRYQPGSVLSGVELRDPLRVRNINGIQVLFWNGTVASVPGEMAVWISPSLYERIVSELQQRLPVRQVVPRLCSHGDVHSCWTPPCPRRLFSSRLCRVPRFSPCQCSHPPCCSATCCHWHDLGDLGERSREHQDLERRVNLQLKELNDRETTGREPKPEGVETVNQAVNTDVSLLHRSWSAALGQPAWKYWRRSPPEALHRQPREGVAMNTRSANWMSPEPWTKSSANHSSLFQLVPLSKGRRMAIKDVLDWKDSKPTRGTDLHRVING